MAKATLTLPTGGTVTIDGTTAEIQQLLGAFGAKNGSSTKVAAVQTISESDPGLDSSIGLADIVRLIKTCEEAEVIDARVLAGSSQLNRTLLPLYILQEYCQSSQGLSSGDIEAITRELGVRVKASNASTTLANDASRYVDGDKVRRRGRAVRYRLNRRGHTYLKEILAEAPKKG